MKRFFGGVSHQDQLLNLKGKLGLNELDTHRWQLEILSVNPGNLKNGLPESSYSYLMGREGMPSRNQEFRRRLLLPITYLER